MTNWVAGRRSAGQPTALCLCRVREFAPWSLAATSMATKRCGTGPCCGRRLLRRNEKAPGHKGRGTGNAPSGRSIWWRTSQELAAAWQRGTKMT